MATNLPALPPGFRLDNSAPPLPPGFTLDAQEPKPYQPPTDPAVAKRYAELERQQAENLKPKNDWASILARSPKTLGAIRTIGRTGRDIGQGALTLPAMILDSPAMAENAIREAFGSNSRAPLPFSQSVAALDSPALADQNSAERFVSGISRSVAGAATGIGIGSMMAGAASPVAQGVGATLRANPAIQAASATTGAVAAEVTNQAGGSPVMQMLAGIGGGLAPSAVSFAGPASVRGILRGGEASRQNMANTIDTFKDVGASPSLGQATQGRVAQATESLLAKTPGSAGLMTKRATKQASDISEGIEKTASQLSPKSSGETAGRAIVKGISGEGGFTERFKAKQVQLYDKLDEYIPAQSNVSVSNTKAALEKLNADIPGAPALSKFFKNAKIGSVKTALESDLAATVPETSFDKLKQSISRQLELSGAQSGALPYEAIKKLRTLVGNEMTDSWAGSDVPRSKWKALYAALSADLENAAKESGNDAAQAWNRANNYTRVGMARLDTLSHVVDKAGGPERIFNAALSGTKDGATTLRAVMQSLPEEAQKTLSATVLRRMGIAKAGSQNDLGDKFSTETFLTNWNSISAEAKRALFDRYGDNFRSSMDQIAKVASNLREGSKVFINPSGTGQAAAQYTTVGAAVMAAMNGRPGITAGIAASAGVANMSARLITNPNFVRWLANSTKAPSALAPIYINQLAQLGEKSQDADLIEAASAMRDIKSGWKSQ